MNKILRLLIFSALTALTGGFSSAGFAASFSTAPISDAFVAAGPTGNLGNNNYGGGGALGLAATGLPNGEFQSVIQFDLSGTRSSLDALYGAGQWSVESVSLQLSSSPHNNAIYNEISSGLFGISLMQNNSWIEGSGNASNPGLVGITYNSLQNTFINNAADESLGTFAFDGGSSGANNYALSLSPALSADILAGDNVSLRLFAADSSVSYLFSSRSMSPANQPQLIITAVPEPGSWALFGLGLGFLIWRIRRPHPRKRIS